uniref:Uncharacterized protein n=1 Tax=Arundo donax TaxID=35708 RepID=A0A0A9BJ93_ARUDO
MTRALGPEQF